MTPDSYGTAVLDNVSPALDGGYSDEELWEGGWLGKYFTKDKKTKGPSTWISSENSPPGKDDDPVSGICFYEAKAYSRWLQRKHAIDGWRWSIPDEDMWEFSARGTQGLAYPWGNDFLSNHCNSAESKLGGTSPVTQYLQGKSLYGCLDMAGNVWEFVLAEVPPALKRCVLRGGSFKNNQWEIRNCFRLIEVPADHRPRDFGFRCAQVLASEGKKSPKQAKRQSRLGPKKK